MTYEMKSYGYLIRIVLQGAVVTVVTHTVSVGISLVHVVNIRAVVIFVQDACSFKRFS